ncbi:MAG: hypothetical protein WEC34_09965 [Acidimicrobiia bacterium]
MGWKGNVRSINSALNELERSAARRQRELARQQVQASKMAEVERAAYEVAVFENTIDVLTSLHRETPGLTDWSAVAAAPEAQMPADEWPTLASAQSALDAYVPKGLAKIGSLGERKRASLAEAVDAARAHDEAANRQRMEAYEADHARWRSGRDIAERVLAGEVSGYNDAFSEMTSFSDMGALGTQVGFTFYAPSLVGATIDVHGTDVVPHEVKSQLKSGKLSTKQMPKGRFYETYQDYVCGAVLRVANDLAALLPVNAVVVTAVDEVLDSSTGRMAEQALVSAVVPRETLEKLDLERVDPSDAFTNFVHRMNFKKTTGFVPVEPLTADDVPADLR